MNWIGASIRKYVLLLALKGLLSAFVFIAVINVTYGFYVQKHDHAERVEKFKILERVLTTQFGDVKDYIDLVKLDALLREFTETNIINAYRITLNDQIYSYIFIDRLDTLFDQNWPKDRSIASVEPSSKKNIENGLMDFEKVTFKILNFVTEEQKISVLMTFIKPTPWSAYFRAIRYQALPMSFMFFGIFLTLLLFIVLSRKEFILLFQNLSRIQMGDISKLETHTPEGLGLRNFADTITTKVGELKNENQEIKEQVLPGKLRILELYKKGITSFEGTLIRMDLNGYTSKRNALGDDAEKKRFFEAQFRQWGDAICAKYGAFVYEFIGDEFVVFLEENNERDHRLMALHLVRSGLEDVFVLNRKFKSLHLPPISIKTSLISGTLELKKERTHVSLDSEPLILSQRLLSNIKEKEESSVILFQEEAQELLNHAEFLKPQAVIFKADDNYPQRHAQKVKYIFGWTDYHGRKQLTEYLKYLRTEKDLVHNLKLLSDFANINPAQQDELWRILLQIKFESPSAEFLKEFEIVFEKMCQMKNESSPSIGRSLAQAVALARILYPFLENPENIQKSLVSLAESPHPRVVANAREALFACAPTRVDLMNFIESTNHRAAVDSLIDFAKKEGVNEFVITQLRRWLSGNRSDFQLSSLYAVFSIALYFKQQKPEYFVTHEGFSKLHELIHQFENLKNPLCQKWIARYKSEIEG